MTKKKPMKNEKDSITTEELDRKFDAGEPILKHFDLDSGVWRVNLDIPQWALRELDREAKRFGVPRQSLIKIWLIERIDAVRKERILLQNQPKKTKPKKTA